MILSFSGRKGAGKTVLRLEAVKRGYKKISFADRLKEITAELYGWTIDSLNCPVEKESILDEPVKYNKEVASKLAEIIHADRALKEDERRFKTRRDALQYLGTDVLRAYDPEFHVKELKKKIVPGEMYVLDDARFLNESSLLNELGATCIYVMRPYYFDYSNHRSEVELLRKDFKYLFMNNGSLNELVDKFNIFMDVSREPAEIEAKNADYANNRAFLDINEDSAYWGGVTAAICKLGSDEGHAPILAYCRNESLLESLVEFIGIDTDSVKWRSVSPYGLILSIYSDFLVDDLKLWNFQPGGYIPAKGVPDVVVNDERLRQRWQAGFDRGMYSGNNQTKNLVAS